VTNLTVAQVATRLLVTERRVQKLCETGAFPGASNPGGKRWIIPEDSVNAYIEAGKPRATTT